MTAKRPPPDIEPNCLYPDEGEIARRVVGAARARTWPSLAAVLERHGLPPVDTMMGGRYWPAVKAFLDRRHHVSEHPPVRPSRRGEEGGNARGNGSVRPRP